MKTVFCRRILLALLLLFLTAAFGGCKKADSGLRKDAGAQAEDIAGEKENSDEERIFAQIWLNICSPSSSHVYYLNYPESYVYVDADKHCGVEKPIFSEETPAAEIFLSGKDIKVFTDFIDRQNKRQPQRNLDVPTTFTLQIRYGNSALEHLSNDIKCYGYGTCPEDFYPVVDKLNELIGKDLIQYPTELIGSPTDFVFEEFGITEEDYSREDVDAMLNWYGYPYVWLEGLLDGGNTIDENMTEYHRNVEAKKQREEEQAAAAEERARQDAIEQENFMKFLEKYEYLSEDLPLKKLEEGMADQVKVIYVIQTKIDGEWIVDQETLIDFETNEVYNQIGKVLHTLTEDDRGNLICLIRDSGLKDLKEERKGIDQYKGYEIFIESEDGRIAHYRGEKILPEEAEIFCKFVDGLRR